MAQPMPAQIEAECRSVIQPLALKSFMKRFNCSASSARAEPSVSQCRWLPGPPRLGGLRSRGTALVPADRAQPMGGNSPLSPSEGGAAPWLWVPLK